MTQEWQVIKPLLYDLRSLSCSAGHGDLKQLSNEHQQIVDILTGRKNQDKPNIFKGLVKFFKVNSSPEEKKKFVTVIFPAIIDLAIDHEDVIPKAGLQYSYKQSGIPSLFK